MRYVKLYFSACIAGAVYPTAFNVGDQVEGEAAEMGEALSCLHSEDYDPDANSEKAPASSGKKAKAPAARAKKAKPPAENKVVSGAPENKSPAPEEQKEKPASGDGEADGSKDK